MPFEIDLTEVLEALKQDKADAPADPQTPEDQK